MRHCPECCSPLEWVDTDNRCEWMREYLYCPECDEEYEVYTVYKCQSSLIASQIMYDSDGIEVG